MQSKVHPTYKTKYRVANWPAYNQALVRRGDVTVWLSSEAIAAWTPRRSGRRGGQRRYSDLAIETALTLRLLSHLPLRQAEGFLHTLFGMMRLDLSAPDYTTLSRRSQHLRRRLRPVPPGEGLQLVLDSTGLSIVGAGEWAAAKHGGCGRRRLSGPTEVIRGVRRVRESHGCVLRVGRVVASNCTSPCQRCPRHSTEAAPIPLRAAVRRQSWRKRVGHAGRGAPRARSGTTGVETTASQRGSTGSCFQDRLTGAYLS